jgi:aminoglycoside phosphotransferase (APT) family kinase protein
MTGLRAANIDFSPAQAARLIERQFPALAPLQLELLGRGLDNVAFRVNGRLVFRFPRHQFAAGLIERELRVLPLLAPRLPMPIPAPAFVGTPDESYPYPFAGYPLLPGTTACRLAWSEEERERNAVLLGGFLSALHGIPVDDETRAWGPRGTTSRTNLEQHAPVLKGWLRAIAPRVAGMDVDALLALLALVDRLAMTPPHAELPCWVHGDLSACHLLADAAHCLCGVIDWGDVALGDPALDLSIAFSFLPARARDRFRAAYGPIDDATWDRARFRALHYGAALVVSGAGSGDEAIRAAGEYALRAAVGGIRENRV